MIWMSEAAAIYIYGVWIYYLIRIVRSQPYVQICDQVRRCYVTAIRRSDQITSSDQFPLRKYLFVSHIFLTGHSHFKLSMMGAGWWRFLFTWVIFFQLTIHNSHTELRPSIHRSSRGNGNMHGKSNCTVNQGLVLTIKLSTATIYKWQPLLTFVSSWIRTLQHTTLQRPSSMVLHGPP